MFEHRFVDQRASRACTAKVFFSSLSPLLWKLLAHRGEPGVNGEPHALHAQELCREAAQEYVFPATIPVGAVVPAWNKRCAWTVLLSGRSGQLELFVPMTADSVGNSTELASARTLLDVRLLLALETAATRTRHLVILEMSVPSLNPRVAQEQRLLTWTLNDFTAKQPEEDGTTDMLTFVTCKQDPINEMNSI
ncbi:hypothetical protein Y032_0245g3569 [Ancylostoma ceylanicum]|uniref:Uncharacterized protein n=1 Tax=Ancylostoma ceylanicum TaxID=53326 RepID=A0A016SD76_9BILA|nr:hypothetical protein Y032_0245g3569 [Ancylostoma ceylanicum]